VVREVGEARPDGSQHDLDTLTSLTVSLAARRLSMLTHLIGLGSSPDNGGDGSTHQRDVDASLTEGRSGNHREVDTVHTDSELSLMGYYSRSDPSV
jgi:hypothetical protein